MIINGWLKSLTEVTDKQQRHLHSINSIEIAALAESIEKQAHSLHLHLDLNMDRVPLLIAASQLSNDATALVQKLNSNKRV